jgi:hypothetical protein
LVKNPFELTRLLFTSAQKMAGLACRSCSIPWINHPRAFGIFVEGNLLDNFGIQSFAHFCLYFWRKLDWKIAKRDDFDHQRSRARRRTARRHVGAPYPCCARTPRHRRTHRSMRHAGVLLCMTSVSAWTVPGGCFPLAGVPTATRH